MALSTTNVIPAIAIDSPGPTSTLDSWTSVVSGNFSAGAVPQIPEPASLSESGWWPWGGWCAGVGRAPEPRAKIAARKQRCRFGDAPI
jgi:hypothetical protein